MNNPETLASLATRHRTKTNKTKKLYNCKVSLLFCKKKYEFVYVNVLYTYWAITGVKSVDILWDFDFFMDVCCSAHNSQYGSGSSQSRQ